MSDAPEESNPYASPTVPTSQNVLEESPSPPWSGWGVFFGTLLFAYSFIAMAIGSIALLAAAAFSICGVWHATNIDLFELLCYAVLTTHGGAAMVTALSLFKSRWKRAVAAFGVAVGIVLVFQLALTATAVFFW